MNTCIHVCTHMNMLIKLNFICMLMSAQRLASHNGGKGGMEVRARDTSHYRYSVAMAVDPQGWGSHGWWGRMMGGGGHMMGGGGHIDGGVT